jgi:hypothetical protein
LAIGAQKIAQRFVDAPGVRQAGVNPKIEVFGEAWLSVFHYCVGADDEIPNFVAPEET